jgi:hypothetical protein
MDDKRPNPANLKMPGHLRYTCCPGTHATVVGFLLWDSTIRYVTRDALLAWPTTMLAWPTTKRCASHTRRRNERDRSLSIARGPLRAWRASAPARRRGTRAEYERESVIVTSVCGTHASVVGPLWAPRRAWACRKSLPSAAGLEADAHALEADAHPLGLVWQGSPPMPPVHLRLARAPGAASARSGGRRRRRPSSSR